MHYFAAWDVGGWNWGKKSKSQDAVSVLARHESHLRLCGTKRKEVCRKNIRDAINRHDELCSLLNEVCGTSIRPKDEITLAIDTPLGFPLAVQAIVKGGKLPQSIPEEFSQNPYLFRKTEEWLFSNDFPCLSAIKDMIGSQATKGMHLIRKLKLKPVKNECGVWKRGGMTAIETYPTTCRGGANDYFTCDGSAVAKRYFESIEGIATVRTEDRKDAVYCAIVAFMFAHDRKQLIGPQGKVSPLEGWIWVPTDASGRKVTTP
jgi:predicted nuclease with RNAse H fold